MFVLNEIIKYAYIIASILSLIGGIVLYVHGIFTRKHKKLAIEDDLEEVKNESACNEAELKLVKDIIPSAINEAETTPAIKGLTKKMVALSNILLKCNEAKIDYETYKDFIAEQLEALITFSKHINARKE